MQANIVARHERRIISWICERLPAWVTPDGLTLGGIGGAFVVFAGYAATWLDPAFVWLATLGIVLHWFGDSLDGSLARYRRCERPNYGYFLDHTVDAFCNLVIVGGLGVSTVARMDVAMFVLCGYFMLCMFVFLNNHVTGVFRLSFLALGPTELRLGMIGINTWFYLAGDIGWTVAGLYFSVYDCVLIATGFVFVGIFVYQVAKVVYRLASLEPAEPCNARDGKPGEQRAHLQSSETKASIFSK